MTIWGKSFIHPSQGFPKITNTIAPEDRNKQYRDNLDNESSEAPCHFVTNNEHSSFKTETSFACAPLNSRVSSASAAQMDRGRNKPKDLDRVPADIQEALILEDLLDILMGIEGIYITYHLDGHRQGDVSLHGIRFVVSPLLDSSLQDLVERILPLGSYYITISSFIEQRSHLDHGLINHALAAAIRDMLRDYLTLLSQLEHAFNTSPKFTLTQLWFYIHPTIHTLCLIYQLILKLDRAADVCSEPSLQMTSSSSSDEEHAREMALGLGSPKSKYLLSLMIQDGLSADAETSTAMMGGEVLTIVYEQMQNTSGDPIAHALYSRLFRACEAPYVAMIRAWTTNGRLADPYDEFFVKENKFINRGTLEMDFTDEYWEERYTFRDGSLPHVSAAKHHAGTLRPRPASLRLRGGACIPPLLEGWKHKILLAGKYLNVIRECGIEIKVDQNQTCFEGGLSMNDEKFYQIIDTTYMHANRILLQLLLKDHRFISQLRTLRVYFLQSQTTFLRHFLDLSHAELRKSTQSASIVKLQSLLDLALSTDSAGSRPELGGIDDVVFRKNLKVTMAESGLYEWLLKIANVSGLTESGSVASTGHKNKEKDDKKPTLAIDALALDYEVKFPLSLVISRNTILRYQLLSRFLLHLKHVEQSLLSMWTDHKGTPWRKAVPNHPELARWRLRIALLRTRMLAFVQQIQGFATSEVLEPNWRVLETKLENVTMVDQLFVYHVDFLDTCLKGCMLTSSKLLEAHSRLIVTCSTFALYAYVFSKHVSKAFAAAEMPGGDQNMAERWVFLSKFETHFNHWLKLYLNDLQLDASSENVSLLPLIARLKNI